MKNSEPRQSAQGSTFVNLMRDSGFKAVYADKDNKQLLIELLNFFLPEDVKVSDIEMYLDREQGSKVESGKRTYLDLICKGEDGIQPLYIICILGKNYSHQDESKWNENHLISHYKFMETETKEFAPSTIIINFVETARFTKALEACERPCDYSLYWFLNG